MSQKSQNSCGCASCAPRTRTPTAPEMEARRALAFGEMVPVTNGPVSMEVQLVQAELRYLASRRDSMPPNLVAPPEPIYRIGATRIYVGTPLPPQLPVDISAFLHNPGVIGIGDPQPWYKVSDPLYPPNNAVGYWSTELGGATAFQISDRHIVTNAHTLKAAGGPAPAGKPVGWYYPAGGGGKIAACRYFIPPEYDAAHFQGEESRRWDYAVLTLAEPSPEPFWFGIMEGPDSLWDSSARFIYLRGFPDANEACSPPPVKGLVMWGNGISGRRFAESFPEYFTTWAPSEHGMSGGPVFVVLNGHALAIGVVQGHTVVDGECRAWVVRFQDAAIKAILQNRYDDCP